MPASFRIAFAAATSLSCLTGCSGTASDTGTRDGGVSGVGNLSGLTGFTALAATGPDDVVVTVGSSYKVAAEGDPDVLKRIDMAVENGTLRIGRKKGFQSFWNHDDGGATIRVSMPAIASASLTGSGNLQIDRAEGPALALSLTGSGDLALGAAKVHSLEAKVTGSGGMRLTGTADAVSLSATGSGDIDAAALQAAGGNIDIMGSGDVSLRSNGAVTVGIMGSGDADVRGGAKCKVSVMGSGEVRCAG